jgi:hypothetical protein
MQMPGEDVDESLVVDPFEVDDLPLLTGALDARAQLVSDQLLVEPRNELVSQFSISPTRKIWSLALMASTPCSPPRCQELKRAGAIRA